MAQLSDDCFAHGGALTRIDDALADLRSRLVPITEAEEGGLGAALGRTLADDITADRSVPPHDTSPFAGSPVHFADLPPHAPTRLSVAGRFPAGRQQERVVGK